MQTQCIFKPLRFEGFDGRRVEAAFDGGAVTSDAGSVLLRETDRAIGLIDRVAECFRDGRDRGRVIHSLPTLIGQRIVGLALGYEDVADHDDLFLDAHAKAPKEIVLDLDATDDPLHGHQEGRFFHGYYDGYCDLPLYVFCGRHLFAVKLRRANIDVSAGAVDEVARIVARIRQRWPRVRILVRADSGFAREALMAWCEVHRVDYVLGLARNSRLVADLAIDMAWAEDEHERTGKPVRRSAGPPVPGLPPCDARQLEPAAPRNR